MSQSSLETVGGGSHENQEAPSPERREHAERCHMLGAIKYTPKISGDACSIFDLFPSGTLSVVTWYHAPSLDLPVAKAGPTRDCVASGCSSSSVEDTARELDHDWDMISADVFAVCAAIQRAIRGFFARKPHGKGMLRYDVGAGFWRVPVGDTPCNFLLDIPILP